MQDLHNHTIWSDSENTIDELIQHAKKIGIDEIGICDHFHAGETPSLSEIRFEDYLAAIRESQLKCQCEVRVLAGLEVPIAFFNEQLDENILGKLNRLDFILLEDVDRLGKHVDLWQVERNLDKIVCSKGLAHTILSKEIFSFMDQNKLFWEININTAYDMYGYIMDERNNMKLYEELNRMNIQVSVGTDTHTLEDFPELRLKEANKTIARQMRLLKFQES